MQIILGIIILAVAWHLLKLYWTLLLLIIVGTFVSAIILQGILYLVTKNKTDEDKKSYKGLFGFLNFIAFIAICYFSGSYWYYHADKYDVVSEKYVTSEEFNNLLAERKEEERIKQENEEKNLKISIWCSDTNLIISDFDSYWKKHFTNDSLTSIKDLQTLQIAVNNFISKSNNNKIPEDISQEIKDKMELTKQEINKCFTNRFKTLEYFINYAEKFEETKIQDYEILTEAKKYYDESKINMENSKKYVEEVRKMAE